MAYKKKNNRNMNLKDFTILDTKSIKEVFLNQKNKLGITNKNLNKIYEDAKSNGAIGGKLLGAGVCFFLFCVNLFKKTNLISFLKNSGLKVVPFTFDNSGLKSWTVRYI